MGTLHPVLANLGETCGYPAGCVLPDQTPRSATCSTCAEGLHCGTAHTCERDLAEGAACDRNLYQQDPCPAGTFCISDTTCIDGRPCPGTCRQRVQHGEACGRSLSCDEHTDVCDGEEPVCRTAPRPGEPCVFETPAKIEYAYCDDGIARARGGPGAACSGGSGSCLGDLSCEDGTCTLRADICALRSVSSAFMCGEY
jgi:hypothetical protein